MIVVCSDTHGRDDARLDGRLAEAIGEATLVIHAGDFVTESVYETFERESRSLKAVYGNNDPAALRERLPAVRTIDGTDIGGIEAPGTRIALCHGHEHTDTSLAMLGREQGARLVISGHSHDPGVIDAGECVLLNPGSHADPRAHRPAYAELERTENGGFEGRLREPSGPVFEEFRVPGPAE